MRTIAVFNRKGGMGKFNLGDSLAAALRTVPESGAAGARERIGYIDLFTLDADEDNFYALDDLDALAANIELVGLQQPLRVWPNPDMPGRYFIVSGHRRRAALAMLVEEGREELREAPCIVEQPSGSAAMQELRLIYANSGTRKISPADLARQAERPEMQCPDGKSCKRGDAFLRRDCEAASWHGFCGGRTCCLECDLAKSGSYPCERMCSKARERRKAGKAEADKAVHKLRQKERRPYQNETQGYARRLLRAIDAAALAEDTEIKWRVYEAGYPVSAIRQWAAGEFDDPAAWYGARLVPEMCDNAPALARLLGCSADFLLGLTGELRPGAGGGARWMPGDRPPERNCDAVCVFGFEDGTWLKQIVRCISGTWRFANGATIDAKCLWWLALPEEPEAAR